MYCKLQVQFQSKIETLFFSQHILVHIRLGQRHESHDSITRTNLAPAPPWSRAVSRDRRCNPQFNSFRRISDRNIIQLNALPLSTSVGLLCQKSDLKTQKESKQVCSKAQYTSLYAAKNHKKIFKNTHINTVLSTPFESFIFLWIPVRSSSSTSAP